MKKNLFMVAALVGAFAMPAISQGAASVWFEYAGGEGSPVQQGPGQVLIVEKPADGVTTHTINMFIGYTDATPLYSANVTLAADGPVAATGIVSTPPAGGAPTPAGGLGAFGPGAIATNFGGATFSGPGYTGPATLVSVITLVVDKTQDHAQITNISASVGTGLFGLNNFLGADVQFADGQVVAGGLAGSGGNTVISFVNVPEPATLSLLGLGAIALIRRRR